MSYSYIKSVFPNFTTSKTYDDGVYNSLQSTEKGRVPKTTSSSFPLAYDEQDFKLLAKNLLDKPIGQSPIVQSPPRRIETYNTLAPSKVERQGNQNNLQYYNIPARQEYFPIPTRESFEPSVSSKDGCKLECDGYVKHILDCNKCKAVLAKQLGLENDRARNEEFMEVLSYMMFGVFILLVLDNFKKDA